MFERKKMAIAALVLVLAAGAWAFADGEVVEQRSVLSGAVLAEGLVATNDKVCEGDVLVNISTATGSKAVAARAAVSGVVREVLVKSGDKIKSGDVLLRIQADGAR